MMCLSNVVTHPIVTEKIPEEGSKKEDIPPSADLKSELDGFTCGSLCKGDYDMCMSVIRTVGEQFMCLHAKLNCHIKCR